MDTIPQIHLFINLLYVSSKKIKRSKKKDVMRHIINPLSEKIRRN
jgi:hypothetical protein